MKKKALALGAAALFLASFAFKSARQVYAAPQQSGMAIINSFIDSTVIGGTSPAAGTFTTAKATNGNFGNLVAGANGLGASPWNPGSFTFGSWLGFNNLGGSNGETDFINFHAGLTGGYSWFSPTTSTLGSSIMSLTPGGVLTVASVHSALTGNVSGSVSGSAVGPLGAFGDLVATYSGSAPGPWTPVNGFTSGTWLSLGQRGGSNQESDFINQYTVGNTGGFAWWAPTGSSLTSSIMSLDTAGNLTVNHVVGNADTATALAANPTDCTVANTFANTIAANGNLSCAGPVGAKTTSVNSTASSAGSTASTSVPLDQTMPDTLYKASCTGVGGSGAPYIQSITKGTTSITVIISNGQGSQAVVSGYSEIDCTVSGT
jgi:hypothetical protein